MTAPPLKVGEMAIGLSLELNHLGHPVATVVISQVLSGGRLAMIYSGTHYKGDSIGRITPVFPGQKG